MSNLYNVIIIGAGQAGLAAAYEAKKRGLKYLVLESHDTIGDTWRNRYDSLVLFTPRVYSNLAEWPITGDRKGFPSKDEVASYLQNYAEHFKLNIILGIMVKELAKNGGDFVIKTNNQTYTAKSVIIATGPFQEPRIPTWAKPIKGVVQLHSSEYRNPSQVQGTKILIVGGGNSGAQITEELSRLYPVALSVSEKPVIIPAGLSRNLFWLLDKLGALNAHAGSFKAKLFRLQKGIPIVGTELPTLMKQGRVKLYAAATGVDGDQVIFQDGSRKHFDTIIWCTGFKLDYSWLAIPKALDEHGLPRHKEGVSTTVEDLYYLGMTWQRTLNSALLGGVKYDASYILEQVADS